MPAEIKTIGACCRAATRTWALICAIAVAGDTGCNATLSVYPIYRDGDGPGEPRLVGEWRGEMRDRVPFRATVAPASGRVYRLTLTGDRAAGDGRLGLPAEYYMRAVKVGERLYLDVMSRRQLDLEAPERYDPLLVSGHLIMMCSFKDASVSLRVISARRLREAAKRDGIEVPMLTEDDASAVLTVPTERLRGLALKYGDAIFEEKALVLRRATAEGVDKGAKGRGSASPKEHKR